MDNLTVEEAKVSKKENKNTGYITCKDSVHWPSDTNLCVWQQSFKETDVLLNTLNMSSPQKGGYVTSHFKGGYVRKPTKSSLRNYILKKAEI